MKSYVKCGLTFGALALVALAMVQTASAQSLRASDKARGYYGPAASPDPADAIWLAPGVTRESMNGQAVGPTRSFSYAPAPAAAPATRAAQPTTPQAQNVRPAPQAAAAAPATTTPRRYSYSYQPRAVYRGMTMDRVLSRNPENRDAAAKANGEY